MSTRTREHLEVLLRNMTDPELISYTNTKPVPTALETELAMRFEVEIFEKEF